MTGVSYSAHAQTAAAAHAPPALASMILDSGGLWDAYRSGVRMNGAFELKQATWAFTNGLASLPEGSLERRAMATQDLAAWFDVLPWSAGNSPLRFTPAHEEYLLAQWALQDRSAAWEHPALCAVGALDRLPVVPTLLIGSWYDPYVLSTTGAFTALSAGRPGVPTELIMGPWTHGARVTTWSGDVDFGADAAFDRGLGADYLDYRSRWLGAVLAGEPTGRPTVSYFVMGGGNGVRNTAGRLEHGGRWRSADSWPPAGREWFLTLAPGGSLVEGPVPPGAISFTADPRNPVPTIGGQVTSGEPLMLGGAFDQRPDGRTHRASAPYLPLSARPDVVVFRTPPMTEEVVIAGPVSAVIMLSSDAPDTDVTVKLIDEYPPNESYPEGFALNLTDGIIRARYHRSFEEPEPLRPGRRYPLEIALPDTAARFGKGHRLRLDVSWSNFPRFDVNRQTGGDSLDDRAWRTARNVVHLGGEESSRLRLWKAADLGG